MYRDRQLGEEPSACTVVFPPTNSILLNTEFKNGKEKKKWGESEGKGLYIYVLLP
jgi:hypothetical protein